MASVWFRVGLGCQFRVDLESVHGSARVDCFKVGGFGLGSV